MEDGMLIRRRESEEKSEPLEKVVKTAQNDEKIKEIPGKLYIDKITHEGYAVMPSGKRVIFGTKNEGMIRCEMEYLVHYPVLQEQLYGNLDKGEDASKTSAEKETQDNTENNILNLEVKVREDKDTANLNVHVQSINQKQKKCKNEKCSRENVAEAMYCGTCGTFYDEKLKDELADSINGIANFGGVVAKDLGSLVKKTAKGTFKAACKVSYPILGNLSANLQERIENLVGKENYNAVNATNVSIYTNITLGLLGGATLGNYLNDRKELLVLGTIMGGVLSFGTEIFGRDPGNEPTFWLNSKPKASWYGKLISLPIEGAIKLYEAGKNYVKSVSERAKHKKEE